MKILVVEDEHLLAASICDLLTARGFEAEAVYDGETGAPLTAEERRDVFKRFYRASPERAWDGGYGLGLSIAQSAVSCHGGKIWAESGQGRNMFQIRLPLANKA